MNRRTAFLIGILLELIAIFGLFIPYEMRIKLGTPVTLRTVPVDPNSLFRGDYVMLGYEAGNEVPVNPESMTEYVVLAPKDEIYERVRISVTKPELKEGEVCLIGQHQYDRIIFPDIAQYFVEEGLGRELEQARNAHRLLVDASIDSSCHGIIRGLRLGPEVPEGERKQLDVEKPIPIEAPPGR